MLNIFAWLLVGVTIYYNIKDVKAREKLIASNEEMKSLIIDNTKAQEERAAATRELIDIVNEVARDNE